jgi:hypothetical protein
MSSAIPLRDMLELVMQHHTIEWTRGMSSGQEAGTLLYYLQPAQIVAFFDCHHGRQGSAPCPKHHAKMNCVEMIIRVSAYAYIRHYMPTQPEQRSVWLKEWLACPFYKAVLKLSKDQVANENTAIEVFLRPFIAPGVKHLDFFGHTVETIQAAPPSLVRDHHYPVDSVLAFEAFQYVKGQDEKKLLSQLAKVPALLLHLDQLR